MAAARRIPVWGIASLALILGWRAFAEYNYYLHFHTGRPWLRWTDYDQICVVVMLAAGVFGVIAVRRGSPLWLLTVLAALLFAIQCFLSEL